MNKKGTKEKEVIELLDKNAKLLEQEIEKLDNEIEVLEKANLRKKILLEELKKLEIEKE